MGLLLQGLVEEGADDAADDQGTEDGDERDVLDLVSRGLHLHAGLAQQRALPFPVVVVVVVVGWCFGGVWDQTSVASAQAGSKPQPPHQPPHHRHTPQTTTKSNQKRTGPGRRRGRGTGRAPRPRR